MSEKGGTSTIWANIRVFYGAPRLHSYFHVKYHWAKFDKLPSLYRGCFLQASISEEQLVRSTSSYSPDDGILKKKVTWIGENKVARDSVLDDLNDDAKGLHWSGLFHTQEERDRSGRLVGHSISEMMERGSAESMVRTFLRCAICWNV